MVWTPPFFLKGGSEFQLPHSEGRESEKLKKGGGSMVQGQVFLKERGGLSLFLFNFFKVYHFYIQKLFDSLQNCVNTFEKKLYFSATIIL